MDKGSNSDEWMGLNTSSKFDFGRKTGGSKRNKAVATARASKIFPNSLFVESLIEQLSRLLEKDTKRQRKLYSTICTKLRDLRLLDDSYDFEEFAGLRAQYSQVFTSLFQQPSNIPVPLVESSRYANEYDELKLIASGGYGKVFHAKHRLDQMEYAVKKIKVRFKTAAQFIQTIGEVKTMAQLNHPNIIQYKAAWLEATGLEEKLPQPVITEAEPSDGIVFQNTNEEESVSTGSNDELALFPVSRTCPENSLVQTGATLYVCMQLCDETLRQWLDRRNAAVSTVNMPLVLHILQQAAEGLLYIHDSGIVHHDIKPSNVFIARDLRVQLGDFGLACTLSGGECPVLSGHQGTSLYAAPEQSRRKCHLRSDMFSLGLVLLELIMPFRTVMERVSVLTSARDQKLPENLPHCFQELLLELFSFSPQDRPSAVELLERIQELKIIYDADNENAPAAPHAALTAYESRTVRYLTTSTTSSQTVSYSEEADSISEVPISELILPTVRTDSTDSDFLAKAKLTLAQQKETIRRLRQTVAEKEEAFRELREIEASNSQTINELRRQLNDKDERIRELTKCLSRTSLSCAEEYRAHST